MLAFRYVNNIRGFRTSMKEESFFGFRYISSIRNLLRKFEKLHMVLVFYDARPFVFRIVLNI